MVAFEAACQKSGRVRLIRADEILKHAPEATRRRKNPLKWNVPASYGGQNITLGLVPDKIFGLQYLDKPEGKNRAYFFLEADRATMPVMRTDIRQTSFYRKMVGYHETWKQGLHTTVYGIKNFRVLTVTSSPPKGPKPHRGQQAAYRWPGLADVPVQPREGAPEGRGSARTRLVQWAGRVACEAYRLKTLL